jgi:triosephosphate isomerase
MLPRELIGCSSKSYFTVERARTWGPRVLAGVASDAAGATGLFICTSFPLIPALLETFGAAGGLVGAQDVSRYPSGPYTGEVSAEVLAELGTRMVMVGHPERRRLFGETDDVVRTKVRVTADAGMAPVIVVGEQQEGESAERAVAAQLDAWLDLPQHADVIVAYEPAWAIGAPQPAPPEHIAESTLAVRTLLKGRVDDPRVVYGGSVQPGTVSAIRRAAGGVDGAMPDGVFMGRFGIDPDVFLTVVREVRQSV